jgi:hypothetical protein
MRLRSAVAVLVYCLAAGFAHPAAAQDGSPSPSPSADTSGADPLAGLQFLPPPGWPQVSVPQQIGNARILGAWRSPVPGPSGFSSNLNLVIEPVVASLDEVAAAHDRAMRRPAAPAKPVGAGRREMLCGDTPAYVFLQDRQLAALVIRQEQVFVEVGTRLVTATYSAVKDDHAADAAALAALKNVCPKTPGVPA